MCYNIVKTGALSGKDNQKMSLKNEPNYEFVWGIPHEGNIATQETVNDFEIYYDKENERYVGEFDRTYEFETEAEQLAHIYKLQQRLLRRSEELEFGFLCYNWWKHWFINLATIELVGKSEIDVIVKALTATYPADSNKEDKTSG